MTKRRVRLKLAALFLPAIFVAAAIADDEPPVAVSIRLIEPDAQLDRFLKLFEGARYPHPAAAFAAWKRAKMLDRDRPEPFSKGLEALIAFFNPEMVRELKTLDDGRFCLRFDAETGRAAWSLSIPRDDGTFAAVATAFSLTDGKEEEPIEGARVDRLGPKDAPILAQKGELVVVASSRDEAARALKQIARVAADPKKPPSGIVAKINPTGFSNCKNLLIRQISAGCRPCGALDLAATALWDAQVFSLAIATRLAADSPLGRGTIAADWLEFAPRDRTIAVISTAIDPRPETWNAVFSAIDQALRVDPANAKLAPARARLGVLTLPSRVRMEADFFPHLLGLTAIALGEPGKSKPDGFVLAFHCDSLAAAERLENETFPRLLGGFMKKNDPARELGDVRVLGEISKRSVSIARRERTVLLSWGDPRTTMSACLAAHAQPERSAAPLVRESWKPGAALPCRAGAFWPGPILAMEGVSSRFSTALSSSPPIVWIGVRDGSTILDSFRWTGARGAIKRFLEALPGEP